MPKDRERTGVQDQKVEGKDGWHCSHQEKQGRQVELFSDSKEFMRGQTAKGQGSTSTHFKSWVEDRHLER
jgi:hypothetical protein